MNRRFNTDIDHDHRASRIDDPVEAIEPEFNPKIRIAGQEALCAAINWALGHPAVRAPRSQNEASSIAWRAISLLRLVRSESVFERGVVNSPETSAEQEEILETLRAVLEWTCQPLARAQLCAMVERKIATRVISVALALHAYGLDGRDLSDLSATVGCTKQNLSKMSRAIPNALRQRRNKCRLAKSSRSGLPPPSGARWARDVLKRA